ncbi:MAG: hypothetical protein AB1589_19290, partial [Cyanobacteriota bacterium]
CSFNPKFLNDKSNTRKDAVNFNRLHYPMKKSDGRFLVQLVREVFDEAIMAVRSGQYLFFLLIKREMDKF